MSTRIAVLRNLAMLSIASYIEMAIALGVGVVVARSLGSVEFGHYAFAVWVCGTLTLLINNALTMSSIRFVAEARGAGRPDEAAALVQQFQRWHGISSATVLGGFVVFAVAHPPSDWGDSLMVLVPLLVVGAWGRAGYMLMASIGKGNERFEVESGSLLLSALANGVLVLLLALVGASMTGFFAVYAVCGLLQNLSARIMLRRLQIRPNNQDLEPALAQRVKRHLLQSGALAVVGLLGDRTIEVLLLKGFSSSEAVGYFAIAGALTRGITYLLAGALTSVLLPAMSRAFGLGGPGAVGRMLHESVRFYWFIGLAIAGLGCTAAPGAVRLLYGSQYEAAIPAVTVNLTLSGLMLVTAAFNAFLTSNDRQGDRIRIALLSMGANLIAGLALVPAFGLAGALGALAITKFTYLALSWNFARRTEGVTMPVSPMARTLGAALLAGALAMTFDWLVPGRFAFIGVAVIFLSGYALASAFGGAWTPADADLFVNILARFGPVGKASARWITARR